MAKRTYTNKERAQAVALAETTNITRAAEQLDIPRQTLSCWMSGDRPGATPKREDVEGERSELADRLEEIAWSLTRKLDDPSKLDKASLKTVAVSLGIIVDKMRLLRSQSTEITETRTADEYREIIRKRLNRVKAGHGPEQN